MSCLRLHHCLWLFSIVSIAAAVVASVHFRDRWLPGGPRLPQPEAAPNAGQVSAAVPPEAAQVLELSPQAQRNLGLVSRPVKLQKYWRTILVPGEIVDRPGVSDRGVTAPAVGVVTHVHAFPGDTVRPGDRLFTLRLLSEFIQNSQSQLFQATRETELVQEQRDRLAKAADGGGIPQVRLIELDQQLRRLQAAIQGYRQDLLTRGLRPAQLESISAGTFVATIDVIAPPPLADAGLAQAPDDPAAAVDTLASYGYELQELKVDLGTQVQAGQALAVLANHRSLFIVGHAFKREAPYLERAAQRNWPIEVEFAEDDPAAWPPLEQVFAIRHLANSVDEASRTFKFFIPLTNQSRSYSKDERPYLVWRFRPGQRVRLHVPVDELIDVIVLPAGAVVREGPEAYVFRQNGDRFDRRAVQVLHEDRLHVVIANDRSVTPGWYLAQGSAASLNRVLKAQTAGPGIAGVHVHADGSVHGVH